MLSASFLMIYESMKTTYPVSKIGRYSFLLPLLQKQVDNNIKLSIIVTIHKKRG